MREDKERRSEVYLSNLDRTSVRQQFPEYQKEQIGGEAAEEILGRTDYQGTFSAFRDDRSRNRRTFELHRTGDFRNMIQIDVSEADPDETLSSLVKKLEAEEQRPVTVVIHPKIRSTGR